MDEWAPERTVVVTGTESTALGDVPAALAAVADVDVVTVPVADLLADDRLAGADALVVGDSPPACDGIETYRRVREADRMLPVVLVGDEPAPERVERALSAGVTEYLAGWTDDRGPELGARISAYVERPALDGAVQARRWQAIVGSLAHDAKNPLNVVTGRLELLDVEETHGDAIRRSVGRVESLLDELSTVASVAGPIDSVEPVDLAETARRVWREVGGAADRLTVNAADPVEADPDCLALVLERLLENALVHAGEDVTVTVGETAAGFYVADDGPGLADDRDRIFEQGYGTAREGEGYGLFVAQSVATAHGWEIVAGATAQGGARFDVRTR